MLGQAYPSPPAKNAGGEGTFLTQALQVMRVGEVILASQRSEPEAREPLPK